MIARDIFGHLPGGDPVERITLDDGHGLAVGLLTLGASIQSVHAPDAHGRAADIALGYDDLESYLRRPEYFGSTVGRVANRIAGGRFTLDGQSYTVPANNGPNALHGGPQGFDRANLRVAATDDRSVTFALTSPHGDQGFPGTLEATATYAIAPGALLLTYTATTDRPTVVALSNHAYWNLLGEGAGSAMDHLLTIPAAHFTPVDDALIPTGELRPVEDTPFDFRTAHRIGERVRAADAQLAAGRGYDHNWALDPTGTVSAEPRLVARLEAPGVRALELLSDQPGIQFYSGNFLDGTIAGKSGRFYRQGDSVVLEPQAFPDAVNRPTFGSVRLDPGDTYRTRILYRFTPA